MSTIISDASGDAPPPTRRSSRPSDMRLLRVWKPPQAPSRYRVDFFNTFARGRATHRVCQRSIVVEGACCAEEALGIAKARFAEIEGVRNWHVHAAEIEIVAIGGGPAIGDEEMQKPASSQNAAGSVAVRADRRARKGAQIGDAKPDARTNRAVG